MIAPGVCSFSAISEISKPTGTGFDPVYYWTADACRTSFDYEVFRLLVEEVIDREDFSSLYLACAIFYSLRSKLRVALSSCIFFSISCFWSGDKLSPSRFRRRTCYWILVFNSSMSCLRLISISRFCSIMSFFWRKSSLSWVGAEICLWS